MIRVKISKLQDSIYFSTRMSTIDVLRIFTKMYLDKTPQLMTCVIWRVGSRLRYNLNTALSTRQCITS